MNKEDVKKTAFIHFSKKSKGRFPNYILSVRTRYYSIVHAVQERVSEQVHGREPGHHSNESVLRYF